MHISYESGILEKPECSPPDDIYLMTANPAEWPNKPDLLHIEFKRGVPVRVSNIDTNEEYTDSLDLFSYLNRIGYLFQNVIKMASEIINCKIKGKFMELDALI